MSKSPAEKIGGTDPSKRSTGPMPLDGRSNPGGGLPGDEPGRSRIPQAPGADIAKDFGLGGFEGKRGK